MTSKNKKIACIFNYAPHYRKAIYSLMDKELSCDFFFGKNLPGGQELEKMDLKILSGFRKESKVYKFRYEWQSHVIQQVFKDYDIYILTGHPSLSNIVFMIFARLFNNEVFLWTHGLKRLEEGRHPLVRFFYQNATGYFLYGNFGKKMIKNYGIPQDRLHVVYNSLDYDKQIEIRRNLRPSPIFYERYKNNDPVIIFSGRLQAEKKVHYILEAMRKLNHECPFNFVVVGDGSERPRLEQKTRQLGLVDRVWFFGSCYDENVLGELFYNATLTVSPGNTGLTAIHSMMYGTPVLTHDNPVQQGPEYEAIIQGETGLLFEYDNFTDMTSKIRLWISDIADREVIREKCYSIVDKYYNPHYSLEVIRKVINSL